MTELDRVLAGEGEGCILCGDSLEVMKGIPDGAVDAVVTDPPAGIAFMGKDWDKDKGGRDRWIEWMKGVASECLRVLKPGGHALVWSIPRTAHWTATAWEDAGFEVRDKVYHCFGSGFPKSLDVSKAIDKAAGVDREDKFEGSFERHAGPTGNKRCEICGKWLVSGSPCQCPRPQDEPVTDAAKQWQGWGTALKPAIEEWHLFRKPLEGTVAENVQKWGTGALNIDGCRVPTEDSLNGGAYAKSGSDRYDGAENWRYKRDGGAGEYSQPSGRWPAQLIHDGSEEVVGLFPQSKSTGGLTSTFAKNHRCYGKPGRDKLRANAGGLGDSGSAARFFYAAKASRSERTCGGTVDNPHPTVKCLALMRYLCRLITPPGGVVLDCFAGSGSTLLGARDEGFRFIGIEQDESSVNIARARLAAYDSAVPLRESRAGQMSLFGVKG